MKLGGTTIVLIVIVLFGLFLRVYDLGEQSIWIDESYTINAALAVHENGVPLLDSGKYYWRGVLSTYLISFFLLFGINEFNARIVSVLFGTLFIIGGYFLGREFHSKRAGLIMSFLLAFSYWQIAWSRQARMYIQLTFFFGWLYCFFIDGWRSLSIRIFFFGLFLQ